jgi:hypothetical protein
VPRQGELEVVRSYRFPHEAHIAKSALEAFGVSAWVLDENQVRHMGDAPGRVKLAVRVEDAEQAEEILSGDHSASLATVPEGRFPAAREEICPRCGAALEIGGVRNTTRWRQLVRALAGLFFARGPAPHFSVRASYRCRSCGLRGAEATR